MKSLKITEDDLPRYEEFLQRKPELPHLNNLPLKIDVTGYIHRRAAILEDMVKRGELVMGLEEICTVISRELKEMGHDPRRARRILPAKYKMMNCVSYKNRA